MNEANVTINGRQLSEGEVMTLRLALGDFAVAMKKTDAIGADAHGKKLAALYAATAGALGRELLAPANV